MNEKDEKGQVIVSPTSTLHEIAQEVRDRRKRMAGDDLYATELALFERSIGSKLERALDILWSNSPTSPQFQYALCWVDAYECSPVFQLCWSKTRFLDLLTLKTETPTGTTTSTIG